MSTVQPITTLNIDNVAYNVADLSPTIQALVNVYNQWNQKLANAQSEFALVQAALNDLQRQIIAQLKADQEAAAKANQAANDSTATFTSDPPGPVTPPAPPAPPVSPAVN